MLCLPYIKCLGCAIENIKFLHCFSKCLCCGMLNIKCLCLCSAIPGIKSLCCDLFNSNCFYFDIPNIYFAIISIRGGVIIKKQENWGLFPKQGAPPPKKKKSECQIRTFETPWGGLNISKMSELQLLSHPIQKKKKQNT